MIFYDYNYSIGFFGTYKNKIIHSITKKKYLNDTFVFYSLHLFCLFGIVNCSISPKGLLIILLMKFIQSANIKKWAKFIKIY